MPNSTEAPDRGPVKFGIVLLGLIGDDADLDIIKLLGKNEEFTLYASVAISNILEDPDMELWELAKYVDGWGKIHLVERIFETDNPQIKHWLIRDGYKNSVMYEYLAYICAQGGDLHVALAKKSIDEEFFNSAGEIIEALIIGGPAENIDDYEHAADVITNYLKHLEPKAEKIEHLIILNTIKEYLLEPEEIWKTRKKNGWKKENRKKALAIVNSIIENPKWQKLVDSKLETQDESEFYKVNQVVEILGMDIWDIHWQRLQKNSFYSANWYDVMRKADNEKIAKIIKFAVATLPLTEIATGPANEMGFGEKYNIHSCLDFILQDLVKYPSFGIELVEAGLKSPVIRNRNMALKVLSEWGQKNWTQDVEKILKEALKIEPNDDVKKRIKCLIDGKPLD